MTDHQNAPTDLPRPGYYADPAGGPHRRWWDGRAWTENLETAPSYVAAGPDGRPYQPPLPADANVNTPWAWMFAISPLLSLPLFGLMDLGRMMTASVQEPTNPLAIFSPGYFASIGIGLLLSAAIIVAAFLDHRALKKMGVVKPFHWAWTFAYQLPYAIGRAVVLRRRVRRGLAPMWLYIACYLIVQVVVFVIVIAATVEAMSAIPFS